MVQKIQRLVSINTKSFSKELPHKDKLDYNYLQEVFL